MRQGEKARSVRRRHRVGQLSNEGAWETKVDLIQQVVVPPQGSTNCVSSLLSIPTTGSAQTHAAPISYYLSISLSGRSKEKYPLCEILTGGQPPARLPDFHTLYLYHMPLLRSEVGAGQWIKPLGVYGSN